MSSLIIEIFLFDDENEEKIGHHGLTLDGVAQILDNIHLVIPNRKNRPSWLNP